MVRPQVSQALVSVLVILLYTTHAVPFEVSSFSLESLNLSTSFPQKSPSHSLRNRLMQQSRPKYEWRPIEIAFDYLDFTNSFGQDNLDYLKDHLLPQVVKFIRSFVMVKYTPGRKKKLQLGGACKGAQISEKYREHFDADLFIIVSPSTVADASAISTLCELDAEAEYRPVAGMIRFASDSFEPRFSEYKKQFATTLHEFLHILGMNPHLFQVFHNNGEKYDNPIKKVMRRGYPTHIVTFPLLVEWNRKYFDCPTDEGPELENEGGEGSLGFHWEKRNYAEEIMVADGGGQKLSELTLRLLDSSGWYKIDYRVARNMTWGRGRGCDFLQKPCIAKGGRPSAPEFCSPAERKEGCQPGRSHPAECAATLRGDVSKIPEAFRYGTIISKAEFMDNCPVYILHNHDTCQDGLVPLREALFKKEKPFEGFKSTYDPSATCFTGTYVKRGASLTATTRHAGCHSYSCKKGLWNETIVVVKIESTEVSCPPRGGAVSVPGFTGTLDCPPSEEVCRPNAQRDCESLDYCSGLGLCLDNQCYCPLRFDSADCSFKFSPRPVAKTI